MGFLAVLRKVKQKEKEIRLLLVGLDNAGKTTVVKRINGEPIDSISPTLGFDIRTLKSKGAGDEQFNVSVWDVGGQGTIRSYWRNYFESTDGVVWVVDAADPSRVAQSAAELSALLGAEKLAGASLLVLANKADLVPPEEVGRVEAEVSRCVLAGLEGTGRHWQTARCSAVTGVGLESAFHWVIADIAARIFMFD